LLSQVEKVFLLVRSKRHLSAEQRVERMLCSPLFNMLHDDARKVGANILGQAATGCGRIGSAGTATSCLAAAAKAQLCSSSAAGATLTAV
jgi:hypothetical protein